MNRTLLCFLTFLTVCCSLGFALQCYSCAPTDKCETQTTCAAKEDACLRIRVGAASPSYQCYSYDMCTLQKLQETFGMNIQYKCCQSNLCNNSVSFIMNKVVLGVVTAFTLLVSLALV